MNYGHNMDPDMERLIHLLKKILKKSPSGADQLSKLGDMKGVNLTICFLTILPVATDEFDQFQEFFEESFHPEAEAGASFNAADLEFKLTSDDVDFLKNNGLSF